MPLLNGAEATQLIRERCPETHVIVLSMYSDQVHVVRALQAGATGYVVKKSAAKEVVEAIRAVHNGGRYLSKELADGVIDHVVHSTASEDPLKRLSSRERQVCSCSRKDIPSRLSPSRCRFHRRPSKPTAPG